MIKAVLPALVPRLSYDDLEIGDRRLASLENEKLRDPGMRAERAAARRASPPARLCRRDTGALIERFPLIEA